MSRNERRDLFAAAALQGLLAGDAGPREIEPWYMSPTGSATIACDLAEALLDELDRRDRERGKR